MMIDFDLWRSIKGFMEEGEAKRLYSVSLEASARGAILEIGSYCGKSAYVIGSACKKKGGILFTIDHHKGSEEQQPGKEYFDPLLFDKNLSQINTFPFLQQTLVKTHLEDVVVPILASSNVVGKFWSTQLSMVFIDGGHSFEAAQTDYLTWKDHILPGGFLVFHDIFLDPQKGGQAPRQVYDIASNCGDFDTLEMTRTLGVLKRKGRCE
ncbi:MAG: class I SAM-dependent methyltransferase [Desulfobacula sp.]|nr:class I SAM-dependent methyltransferase [Desulfobacula sp.]